MASSNNFYLNNIQNLSVNCETLEDIDSWESKSGKVFNKLGDLVPTNIYFNEYLTAYYKNLLYEAKKVKKEKKYAYLWVKFGKILLKKNKDSKIETLLCNDDLRKM